jgi:hypothetical protein
LHIALSDVSLEAHPLSFSQGILSLAFRLFHKLLVWANKGSMDGVGSGHLLSVCHATILIVLLVVDCAKLTSLAAADGRVLTASVYVLLRRWVVPHKGLIRHGLNGLAVVFIGLLMEKLRLSVQILI